MAYVSDKTKIVHAQGSHKYVERDKDILVEWWKVANVTKYNRMAIPHEEAKPYMLEAVKYAEMIANLDFVYKTHTNRWELYTQTEKYRAKHPDMSTEEILIALSGNRYGIDCSALVLACMKWAGFPFVGTWKTYTSGLEIVLRRSGLFDIYTDTNHLQDDKYAKLGALYWKKVTSGQGHVVMSINDYPDQPEPKPEVEPPYLKILKGSYNVRSGASSKFKAIGTAKVDDVYQIIGEADNGWHIIDFNDQDGYITNAYDGTRIEVVEEEETEETLPKTEKPSVRVLSGKTMNVRSAPTSVSKKVRTISEGLYPYESVTSNNWAKLEDGYVSLNTSNTELVNIQ